MYHRLTLAPSSLAPSSPIVTCQRSIKPIRLASLLIVAMIALTGGLVRGQAAEPAGDQPVKRSDDFDEKLTLLKQAYERQDFELARSLTHSLRDTVIQKQAEGSNPGEPLVLAADFGLVETLPPPWRKWAHGWNHFKTISVNEPLGEKRDSEPVEFLLSVDANQAVDLRRELRLALVRDGELVEIPCQVFREVRRNGQRFATVLWLASCQPNERQTYLAFYGNPDAELPQYPSDLETTGEGVALDISNAHFKASLSRQTGQLERLTLRREHGLELFAGGEGHGEPPGIDWAHDYVDDGHFQKLRISLWERCPDFEVIRGPICTIVRRWGFPHSPVHPVYTPSRLQVAVEYRFFSGLPWFQKTGSMKAIKDFRAEALRDDEWVFSGQSFTDPLWIDASGKVQIGAVPGDQQQALHGVGFFNRQSHDSFIALFLEHSSEGIPPLLHTGSPTMFYRWHGAVWSRYPLPVKDVPAGAVLKQKNAYLAIPFTPESGPAEVERLRRLLANPLKLEPSDFDPAAAEDVRALTPSSGRLARSGETPETSTIKRQAWQALRDCKDAQLYTADIDLVELGLIYDVRVRGDVVTVVMTTPHRGRGRYNYFVDGSISVHPTLSVPIRERLMRIEGVRQVVIRPTWDDPWDSNRLSPSGRVKLGLPEN